jgi:nucleoside-diphosphate-sugar epimerase
VTSDRHILLTGAGGFIGSRVARAILGASDFQDCRLTLLDLHLPGAPDDPRVRRIEGDVSSAEVLAEALDGRADVVLHLAGVLGGAAEANYALARRINVDATLDLFEALRDPEHPPRLVFASSIAVFGPDVPPLIDDDTTPLPTMSYGAQKRMMEIAVEQFSARGWIDGLAIRLPGIVARRDADARLKSAFLNTLFYDYAAGRDITLPVSPDGTSWLISVAACVEAFLHAMRIPPEALGARRAFTLPAQRVPMEKLVAALAARFPESPTRVTYAPNEPLEKQFARQPALTTSIADSLGFQHDGDLGRLVERAME